MFLTGLDRIDRQIIELLMKNARMSYSDIGNRVGLSRVAVKARIFQLEKRGIIEEYTAIINPQKIGGAISGFFEIEVTPAALREVIDILTESELVTQLYLVSGKNRLHVHAVCSSQEELERFISGTIHQLPDVVSLDCSVILSRLKDKKGLRL